MMVLSSLFKPKPMISVILTKDKGPDLKGLSEFSSIESRLDQLSCRVKKLKKQSKKIFECNKLDTISAFEACCAEIKKKKCKDKKNVCKSKRDKCLLDDSCNIDDFSCGDQLALSGESEFDSGGECEELAEGKECQYVQEEDLCEEEKACGEEQAEEACQEENKCECEEEEEKPAAEENEGEEEKEDDKECTQVLTAEPKGSTYYLSQVELQKEGVPKMSSTTSHTSSKTPDPNRYTCTLDSQSSATKDILQKESLVVPIITTTSANSLLKSNLSPQCIEGEEALEEQDSSNKPTIDTFPIQNDLNIEINNMEKIPSVGSQGPIQSVKSGSKISVQKTKSKSSRSVSKVTLQNSHNSAISVTKSKSLSNRGLSKDGLATNNDNLAVHVQQVTSDNAELYSENKQPSIIYIVQTPSKRNINSLNGEGVIHIDASQVFIQSNTPLIENSGSSSSTFTKQDVIYTQLSGEQEKKPPTLPDKIESRVSFQQAEVIEFDDRESKVSSIQSTNKENIQNRSAICANTLYDTSSKIIPNADPTLEMLSSNAKINSLNQFPSDCDTIKKSHDQWVSDCDAMKTSQAQFTSDCDTTKTSQAQFVSDCDMIKTSQAQFVSNCETMERSQTQFTCSCEAMKTKVQSVSSAYDAVKTSQVQFVSNCESMKISQDQLVSNCGTVSTPETQSVTDCEAMETQIQFESGSNTVKRNSECVMNVSTLDDKLVAVETDSKKDGDISLRSLTNSLQQTVSNPMESESLIKKTSLSQIQQASMQVQAAQLSESGFQQNVSGQISSILTMKSAELQTPMTIEASSYSFTPDGQSERDSAESQTKVMSVHTIQAQCNTSSGVIHPGEEARNPMEKPSFTVLQNTSEMKSLNYVPQKRSTSSLKANNESPQGSKIISSDQIKSSQGTLNTSVETNSSLGSQTTSETSQQNEIITMFLNTNIERSRKSTEFLLVHCSKCKELCIAKILEKKHPPDIWTGHTS